MAKRLNNERIFISEGKWIEHTSLGDELWLDADDIGEILNISDIHEVIFTRLRVELDYNGLFYRGYEKLYLMTPGAIRIAAMYQSDVATRFTRWVTETAIPTFVEERRVIKEEKRAKLAEAKLAEAKQSAKRGKGRPRKSPQTNKVPPIAANVINIDQRDIAAATRLFAQFLTSAAQNGGTATA